MSGRIGVFVGPAAGLAAGGMLAFRAVNPMAGAMTLAAMLAYLVNRTLRDREETE